MGLSKRNVLNERNVLKAILAVDGPGSNIDADMVDGYHAEELLPEIDPVTGNWVIGGENIGVSAQGPAGEPGATPTIDPITKHWIINGVDTGVSAEGQGGSGIVVIPQGSDIPIAERTENTWYFKVTDTQSNIIQTVRVAPNIGFSFE